MSFKRIRRFYKNSYLKGRWVKWFRRKTKAKPYRQ
jgi:hypothetical protein